MQTELTDGFLDGTVKGMKTKTAKRGRPADSVKAVKQKKTRSKRRKKALGLSNAEFRELAATHRPAQEWYERDEDLS